MPLPKRRHSSTRRDKRRTHDVLKEPIFVKDKKTGEVCRPHMAYWQENKLYYKGNVVYEKNTTK